MTRPVIAFPARVEVYALALLDDAPVSPAMPIACGELAAPLLDAMLAKPAGRGDARNVETILSRECGVTL